MNYYLMEISPPKARISVMFAKIEPQQLCSGRTASEECGEAMLPVLIKGRSKDTSRQLSKLCFLQRELLTGNGVIPAASNIR
jgi:hypothetical protein